MNKREMTSISFIKNACKIFLQGPSSKKFLKVNQEKWSSRKRKRSRLSVKPRTKLNNKSKNYFKKSSLQGGNTKKLSKKKSQNSKKFWNQEGEQEGLFPIDL